MQNPRPPSKVVLLIVGCIAIFMTVLFTVALVNQVNKVSKKNKPLISLSQIYCI